MRIGRRDDTTASRGFSGDIMRFFDMVMKFQPNTARILEWNFYGLLVEEDFA